MKKKIIVSLICIAIISFIGFKLATNKKTINARTQPLKTTNVRVPVTITVVKETVQEAQMTKTGTLAPFKEAKVLSMTNGNIKRLLFGLGDNVREGQTLAVMDTRLLEIDLQKSESNLSKLKSDLKVYTDLLAGKAATQEKVNEIRQSYTDAQYQNRQMRRQISDATLKAPTSGIIGSKTVEEGMFVGSNTEIASIFNLSQVKVQVYLTESEVYKVKLGQKVNLKTDVYPDKSFTGTVTFISPHANQAYNYQTEITAPNRPDIPLRSGTFVYVDFSTRSKTKILVIPREALIESTQDATVFIVQNGKSMLRHIKVGAEYGGEVQVNDGLKVGDQIITSGQINLRDGSLVNISR